jgi:hypothetical protein
MAQVDMLSSEEQVILLWIAQLEIGPLAPNDVALVDRPALDRVSAVVDQLVRRGLLGRNLIHSFVYGTGPHGLSAYLTDQGVQAVIELWDRRSPWEPPRSPLLQ